MKLFLLVLLAVAGGAAVVGATSAGSDRDASTLSQISTYRQWTRVNSEPVKVEVPVIVNFATLSPTIPIDVGG